MSNKVQVKRSNIAGKAPTTSQLEFGELAINTADGYLFYKQGDGYLPEQIITVSIVGHIHTDATQYSSGFLSYTDKAKLDGIQAGAQTNQNTYSNFTDGYSGSSSAGSTTDTFKLRSANSFLSIAVTNNDPTYGDNALFTISSGSPSSLTVGGSNNNGVASTFAKSDHLHSLPAFGTGSGTFCQGNDGRLSDDRTASGLRTASSIVSISSNTAPSDGYILVATSSTTSAWRQFLNGAPVTIDASAASAGSALTASRSDHKHMVSVGIPGDIGTQNLSGSANTLTRSDHTHNLPFSAVKNALSLADGYISVNNQKISYVADATAMQDAVNMRTMYNYLQGFDVKPSVRAIATSPITLSGTQTIDQISLIANDRVLVTGQSSGKDNGIYVVNASTWTRATDADGYTAGGIVTSGMFVFVEDGYTYKSTGWVLQTINPIIVGTTPLTFIQFSGLGEVVAGNGLTKSGNTISALASDTTISVGSSGISVVPGNISHGSLKNLTSADDHTQYVSNGTARTITAQHSFSPGSTAAPFALGANAQGQLVTGLNSDQLDGYHWTSFVLGGDSRLSDDRTASGIRTSSTVVSVSGSTAPSNNYVLIASNTTTAAWAQLGHSALSGLTSGDDHTQYVSNGTARTITAQHTFSPGTAIAPFVLGSNALGQLVTGLNADYVDGYHWSSFVLGTDSRLHTQNTDTGTTNSTFTLLSGDAINKINIKDNAGALEFWKAAYDGYVTVKANIFQSAVTTGTSPLIIASTTVVSNLNADMVDGYHYTSFVLGTDSRLSDDRTASGIRTATSVVSVSGSTAPSNNYLLIASNSTTAAWAQLDHSALTGLTSGDPHTQYVSNGTARTITAQHSFSPGSIAAPFALGTNAQGQLVTGLNADQVDGYHWTSFVLGSDSRLHTQNTDTGTTNSTFTLLSGDATNKINIKDNAGILEFWKAAYDGYVTTRANIFQSVVTTGNAPLIVASTTNVTNLNADLLDGYHYTSFVLSTDSRLSDDRTASGLRTSTGIVSISGSSAPSNNNVLIASSGTAATWGQLDHSALSGLTSGDPHTQYVANATARTITAIHTFNPTVAGAAFIIGANADGYLITGLNADKVDGYHASTLLNQNAFSNVAVSGQTTIAATTQTDTLTLAAGTGISITTATKTATINYTGTVINSVTVSGITAGTTTVDSFADSTATACHWAYVVSDGYGNLRTGVVMGVWYTTSSTSEYTETSTKDIGSTSAITFSFADSSNIATLSVTVTGGATWTVKLVRTKI